MIASLKGILIEKNPPQIVVECNGVGYQVDVPMSTFYGLPNIGDEVFLLTEMIVREDAQLLYGFLSKTEKKLFRQLLKVSGIGAKIALAILSSMNVQEISNAIATQDVALLTKIPGIGKKTAERLVLELKDKVSAPDSFSSLVVAKTEVLQALVSLGFSDREAILAVKQLPDDIEPSEGIRLSLKKLAAKG